jgi:HAD superfamily hydrolase (TIGR01509 family)
MLQGVIFDMDGVIIDSHPAHRRAWQEFLRSLGKDVSHADLDFVLDGRKRNEILRHFLGDLSEHELRHYGDRKDKFFREALPDVKPIQGVIELIVELHDAGVPIAVATSASESRTRYTLQQLHLSRHFAVVVTGSDVVVGKPDPSVYQLVCQRLGKAPATVIAFEDAVSGIRAATEAGIICIGVTGHQSSEKLRRAGAVEVIENFKGCSIAHLESTIATWRHRASGLLVGGSVQTPRGPRSEL